MQTVVQKPTSIRFGSGILFVDGVNIGALEKAKLETKFNVIEIKADNAKLPPKKKIESVKFSADLYELDLANLQKVDSHGVLGSVAGSATPVTGEILKASGTFGVNETIFFANKNGDGSAVASIVVKNGTTTLVLGTDYQVIVSGGKTGIVRIGTALTLSGIGLNVSYSYTPNASVSITYSDIAKLVGFYVISFENTDENGKKFTVTIPKGYSGSDLTMAFASDDKVDEVMKVPFEVTAFPDSQNRLLIINDEQSV